jgi:hypothetical protein
VLAASIGAAIFNEEIEMKTLMTSLTLVASVLAGSAFAASSDFYLQIKDSKGAVQTLSCPGGVCTAPSLPAESYTLTVVDAASKPLSLDSSKYECTVKSPRDAASGLATGKRQHKPMVFSKDISSSSLVTTEADSNVTFTCVSSPIAATAKKRRCVESVL